MTDLNLTESPTGAERRPLLLCFSHLRWNFVLQRPQHLMQRLAEHYRVIFWEEPTYDAVEGAGVVLCPASAPGVRLAVPKLPAGLTLEAERSALAGLLDDVVAQEGPAAVRWYYTPMMLTFSRHLPAACTIYDCMDELANFRFAPTELIGLEEELLKSADRVFTGGYSLFEAKRGRHPAVLPFPSSVDVPHFADARQIATADRYRAPCLGFYGVIDERMDLALIAALADARPDWEIEMVGPVVKIDPAELPQRANLSYPGARTYDELPGTLAAWDVALMPFAINEATRFISPTKTPEYLAAGRPVVSTPIVDVVRHYGELTGVFIADGTNAFIAACDAAVILARGRTNWLADVDTALASMSWNHTANAMRQEIDEVLLCKAAQHLKSDHYDAVVVGAGFAGAVMAERLARDAGLKVLVIDRRPHIAGNAFDRTDAAGILIHQYGPHIFHTNSGEIVDYLSAFTEWRPYEHRVLAKVGDKSVPMPINRTTLNLLFDCNLESDQAAADFLAGRAEPVSEIRTSEDVVVNAIGRELYEMFFRGYTRKQWGLDPSELDKSVTARVPTRTNTDDRYFTDSFQAMPAAGYTQMFERMLAHANIEVLLGVDFADVRDSISFDELVYTGPIDEYFGFRYGRLPYRSLKFVHETRDCNFVQTVATVNFPEEATSYTRITEYKHLTGQVAPRTSITYEYPSAEGDPYYPIPRAENQALFKRYEALADAEPDVIFVGRLATYRYYNMDQVVGQALATYRRMQARRPVKLAPSRIAFAAA